MKRKNTVLAVLALLLVCLMPVRAAAFSDVHAGDWFQQDVDAMTGDGLLLSPEIRTAANKPRYRYPAGRTQDKRRERTA